LKINLLIILFFTAANNLFAQTSVDTNLSIKNAVNIVEKEPQFIGGVNELSKFLSKNVKYPEQAELDGIMGTGQFEFVVCEDGTICNIKITSPKIDETLKTEALRVMMLMPKWEPAKIKDKNIACFTTMPISFGETYGSR
jgi:periplasmic protein TonB